MSGREGNDMVPEELIRMARTYQVLSDLTPEQLRKLLPIAEDQQFVPGEIIFKEGDRSAFLHLIVEGDVALEETAGGGPVRVQTLHAGEAMGWSALSDAGRTHFQARSLTPTSTVAFPGEHLRVACDRNPDMGYALMRHLLDMVTERLDAVRLQLASSTEAP
jgi:CRP/FNR family transcriptional regulator, cyclic AMP receptor protein